MKLILDTNIYYSAIGFDNQIYDFLYSILANYEYKIYCSQPIFHELQTKLYSKKFDLKTKNKLDSNQKEEFLKLLQDNLTFVEPNISISKCRDPDDDKFLELAATIQADFLISGDKDLLILDSFENTKIIKPSQFLALNLV